MNEGTEFVKILQVGSLASSQPIFLKIRGKTKISSYYVIKKWAIFITQIVASLKRGPKRIC